MFKCSFFLTSRENQEFSKYMRKERESEILSKEGIIYCLTESRKVFNALCPIRISVELDMHEITSTASSLTSK